MINQSQTLLLCLFLVVSVSLVEAKLKFVIELFRHGARGTNHGKYLNNTTPYDDYISGELTGSGERQHFYLGQALRKQYVDDFEFLSKNMNFTEISILSTDLNRTLMSAQSQLLGLYPFYTGQRIPQNMNKSYLLPPWTGFSPSMESEFGLPNGIQSVPIHTEIHAYNAMLHPSSSLVCPNYDKIDKEWKQEPAQQAFLKQLYGNFTTAAEEVGKILSQNITAKDFYPLYENIMCDLANGLYVPDELKPGTDLYRQIKYVSDMEAYWQYNNEELDKLAVTNMFGTWIEYIDNAINNVSPLKMLFLSAHDTQFRQVLPALNLTSTDCINNLYYNHDPNAFYCTGRTGFAANLILEVYVQNDTASLDSAVVKMKFNNNQVPLCDSEDHTCSYGEFRERLQGFIYSKQEFHDICFDKSEGQDQDQQQQQQVSYSSFQEGNEDEGDDKYSGLVSVILIQGVIILGLLVLLFRNRFTKQEKFVKDDQKYTDLVSL